PVSPFSTSASGPGPPPGAPRWTCWRIPGSPGTRWMARRRHESIADPPVEQPVLADARAGRPPASVEDRAALRGLFRRRAARIGKAAPRPLRDRVAPPPDLAA